MTTALFAYERLVPTVATWVFLVTFFFDGEAYDYLFEVGTLDTTEQQAADLSKLAGFRLRARSNFLRDVELTGEH